MDEDVGHLTLGNIKSLFEAAKKALEANEEARAPLGTKENPLIVPHISRKAMLLGVGYPEDGVLVASAIQLKKQKSFERTFNKTLDGLKRTH